MGQIKAMFELESMLYDSIRSDPGLLDRAVAAVKRRSRTPDEAAMFMSMLGLEEAS